MGRSGKVLDPRPRTGYNQGHAVTRRLLKGPYDQQRSNRTPQAPVGIARHRYHDARPLEGCRRRRAYPPPQYVHRQQAQAPPPLQWEASRTLGSPPSQSLKGNRNVLHQGTAVGKGSDGVHHSGDESHTYGCGRSSQGWAGRAG